MESNQLRRLLRIGLIGTSATTSLAAIAAIAAIDKTARHLTHPKNNDRHVDRSLFGEVAHEDVSFENIKDGLTIRGSLCDPGNTDKVVIIGHGFASHRLNRSRVALANELNKQGIAAFLIDYRNSGESDDGISGVGVTEVDDTMYASFFLEARGFKQQALFGGSQGGATSLVTASKNPLIKGVVAETTFYTLEQYLTENAHLWMAHKVPEVIMQKLIKEVDGHTQLNPKLLPPLFRAVRRQGVDISLMQPSLAIEKLNDEGVPIHLWTHENDQVIPPERNTIALGQLLRDPSSLHVYRGEATVVDPTNERDIEKARTNHVVAYEVLGQDYVAQVVNQLKSGLESNLNRESTWQADWREIYRTPATKSHLRKRIPQPVALVQSKWQAWIGKDKTPEMMPRSEHHQ